MGVVTVTEDTPDGGEEIGDEVIDEAAVAIDTAADAVVTTFVETEVTGAVVLRELEATVATATGSTVPLGVGEAVGERRVANDETVGNPLDESAAARISRPSIGAGGKPERSEETFVEDDDGEGREDKADEDEEQGGGGGLASETVLKSS